MHGPRIIEVNADAYGGECIILIDSDAVILPCAVPASVALRNGFDSEDCPHGALVRPVIGRTQLLIAC